jgi:hypothetical protein
MKVQNNSQYTVTERRVYLSIQELVALKSKWEEVKEQFDEEEDNTPLIEMDTFMEKLFVEVKSHMEVYEELFKAVPDEELAVSS